MPSFSPAIECQGPIILFLNTTRFQNRNTGEILHCQVIIIIFRSPFGNMWGSVIYKCSFVLSFSFTVFDLLSERPPHKVLIVTLRREVPLVMRYSFA